MPGLHGLAQHRDRNDAIGLPCRMEIVQGATRLFEEPGTREQVAALARDRLAGRLSRR